MASEGTIEIMVVENQALWAKSLGDGLEFRTKGRIRCVGIETRGREAVKRIQEIKPDVVLLDLKLPDISGLEVARRVLEQNPDCRIIALTKLRPHQPVTDALAAGFKGFLTKDEDPGQIVSSIELVMEGGIPLSNSVLDCVKTNQLISAIKNLSAREVEVAELVAEGFRDREIAEKLSLSENTIKKHVGRCFDELCPMNRSRTQLAVLVTQLKADGTWSMQAQGK